MTLRYSWIDLIPIDETRAATTFMTDVWKTVSRANPEDFKYKSREPDLTAMLTYYLQCLEGSSRLLGFWNTEAQIQKKMGPGKLSRTRKDLSYQAYINGYRLDLTFEFKKITSSNLATYRGNDGMKRFVDGDYAIGKPIAFMVGITRRNDTDPIDKLFDSLQKNKIKDELDMIQDSTGRYIIRPSEVVPGSCVFDTGHNRPSGKAPPGGVITVGHIFVECPA